MGDADYHHRHLKHCRRTREDNTEQDRSALIPEFREEAQAFRELPSG